MQYSQVVGLKDLKYKDVEAAFHDIHFVKFLTSFQPVKIIQWEGIKTDKVAYFKLWFFGWKDFKVKHQDYKKRSSFLSFIDKGFVLPFGLTFWEHKHTVEKVDSKILVKDLLEFSHGSKVLEYLLFPILVSPIFIRKILYHLYFNKIK